MFRQSISQWRHRLSNAMTNHPIAANSLLCFNLWVAGDVLAQWYERSNDDDDDSSTSSSSKQPQQLQWHWQRTAQAASYGAIVCGPLYAVWYPWLDQVCAKQRLGIRLGRWIPMAAGSAWAVPMIKVAVDELCMDPPTISLFFAYMECCQWYNNKNHSTSRSSTTTSTTTDDAPQQDLMTTIRHKIQAELPTAWITSLCTWPAVLLITFRYVPMIWQPALVNVCAIVWDGFLSHRNALAAAKNNNGNGNGKSKISQEEEQPVSSAILHIK